MRNVTESTKKYIAGRQLYKCANEPGKKCKGLDNYNCPLWNSSNNGSFDESGYQIDHIEELVISDNNNINNLQALCKPCHAVKTALFLRQYNKKKIINKEENNDTSDKDDSTSDEENYSTSDEENNEIYEILGFL